jgi:hypothetical protein
MRRHHTSIALTLVVALSTCTTARDSGPDADPAAKHAPAAVAGPMADFARMVPGEWRVTYANGLGQFDTWHWGPGEHSMRVMTDGFGGAGEPWRELQVLYWHPGRKQVRLLGLNPYARSVAEGSIAFAGETADAVIDLYQTGVHRDMSLRWTFDGPDKYRETLSETLGPGGPTPLAEWDYARALELTAARPPPAEAAPRPSEHLQALEPLLGRTWEARGDAFHVRSTFEWIPYADGIYASTYALTDREPTHLLDAYFYHHTGADALRCLALANHGGVYEGDVTVLDGGALQLDLQGHEGDRVVRRRVRLDFEPDGTLRQRDWSLGGAEPELMRDLHHKPLTQ